MKERVARALLEIDAVGFTPDAPITFKSGIISPVYVDNRRLIYHPEQWHTIIESFRVRIHEANIKADVIAGVAVGGVPHSSALAYLMQLPSVFIRKAAKEHGTSQRIEGGSVANKQTLLVEDLVTTGGSSLSGVQALRETQATVSDVFAIVSYGFQEADDNFKAARTTLHTLTDFDTILDIARSMNKFNERQHQIVRDWFDNPYDWADRHSHL